jgi:glutaredoxin
VTQVTLFTQDGCPDSDRARHCLSGSGVSYIERNVSTDPGAVPALVATGIFATPVVVADGNAMLVTRPRELARVLGFTCLCADGGDGGRRTGDGG